MTQIEFIHLAPYIVSLVLLIAIMIYSVSRSKARGAGTFSVYMFAQTVLIGGFVLELTSNGINTKLFWDGVQWLAGALAVTALPVFSVQFTDFKIHYPKRIFGISLVLPVLFSILFIVPGISEKFIYADTTIVPAVPFNQLEYGYRPAIYIAAIYSYGVILWSCYILIRSIAKPHGLYRTQIIFIMVGILLPVLGSLLSILDNNSMSHRDIIPITLSLGNLSIAWGLFKYRIFEAVPIGRDQVFGALVDPVVILDKRNLVVDLNQSMVDLLGKSPESVIGEPAEKVFDNFPIPIKSFSYISHARTETVFNLGRKDIHYELTIWPLYDKKNEMIGRVFISHDITALKELESELRKLNSNLEERVDERTRALTESYETTLEGLARALEFRDKDTEGHSRRVTENTLKIARRLKIEDEELEAIRQGAILHDIGKIGTPDSILHKPGKLTPEERLIVEEHPVMAHKLLSPIKFLENAMDIPYSHHEKWDGTGYPQKLKGKNIPIGARIFAVADVWDALSNDRPYKKAWEREKIIEYFKEESGKHFDPYIVEIFLELVEKGEI